MAIAFDNVIQTNSTSTSYSYTTSGSNRFLVLYVVTATVTAVSATYNGVSLTAQINQQWVSQNNWTQALTLINPTSGSNTLAITGSPLISTLASYTGVSQSGQPEVKGSTSGTSANPSRSIITLTNNDWALFVVGSSSGTPTGYSNVTQRGSSLMNGLDCGDSNSAITPAGSYTQSATLSGSSAWAVGQIAIAPSVSVATGSMFSVF